MKKIRTYVERNWLWIVLGLLLTGIAIDVEYKKRGYMAFGGEWMVLPIILLALELVRNVADFVRMILETEDKRE